jgi:hypothetical protein
MPAMRSNSWPDSHLLKLQRLQNKIFRTIGKLPWHTPTRDLHMAFKMPYLYDFVTKLCRQQSVILNESVNIRNFGQGEAQRRKD